MRRRHHFGSRLCSILLAFTLVLGLFPAIQSQKVSAAGIDPIYAAAYMGAETTSDTTLPEAASILLDGKDIKVDNVNGLTFKGFGVLSANSTNALLMDYKSEQPEVYAEMLQILFGGENPLMRHVKIEMGNDRNNSTGPDPATMRTEDEEANVRRHPGFQLAADAKAVNPDLKVSILRWSAPAWANSNNDKIYTWYKNTILAAYREYGYMVDYVNPHIHEHAPDLTWTKQYANRVKTDNVGFASPEEQELYNQIKVVISDEVGIGSFGGSMVNDATLREAAPIAAYHYNTDDDSAGNFKRLAEQFDIEIWNSEAQATFSNSSFRPNNNTKDPTVVGTGIGGTGSALEMGNTIIKGFVNSRRTHFIYQPAIGSFYEGGQYSFKELLSARDPWSGWIHYDAGLVILQHFSWFANTGWENESNTEGIWRAVPQASYTGATGTNPVNGRNGTPSYMTLASPDKRDFSTVFVNDSEYERTYKLKTVDMGYTGTPELEAWETRAAVEGEAFNSNYMQYRGQITADGSGTYTIKVKPYSIVTVSTLENKDNPDYRAPLPVEGERTVLDTDSTGNVQNTEDNVLYADNFDYRDKEVPVIGADGEISGWQSYIQSRGGEKGAIPRYTHDRNGAFEAYLDEQTNNYVLRQQLDRSIMGLGGTWNNGEPVTAIGDNRWMNYKASVDVSFENNSTQGGANYAAIGARYQGGGSSHSISGTPYVLKFWFDGGWQLLVNNSNVASGNVATGTGGVTVPDFNTAYDAWHKLAIEVAGDKITAYIDGVELASYTDPNAKLSGRVDLASGYYHVRFDNLLVETVDGFTPYYTELLDDLEMHDLAPQPKTKLIYNDLWNQVNGQGMFHYQRSLSTSQGAGATLEYTFTGTGLDIFGPNNGAAKLEVIVDGQVVIPSANTIASKELYQAFALRGLEYGKHTAQIKVLSGTLTIDAVAVVGGNVRGAPDVTALGTAVAEAQTIEREDEFTERDWQRFEAALAAAKTALDNPSVYRLDQEGADQLVSRLADAQNQLLVDDVRELSSPHYVATYVGEAPNLPSTIEAILEDGSTALASVKWNLQNVNFDTPYETVAVSGNHGSLTTVAYVEIIPQDIAYFVDLNGTVSGSLGYNSPAYESVAALAADNNKPLLNNKPDQQYDAASGWGHEARNSDGALSNNYKGIVSGTYNKQSTTGLYTVDQVGATLTYTFPNLPVGEYMLTLGSYSWWASNSRSAEVSLIQDDESSTVDTITLDSSSYSIVKSYPVTMEEAGTLKLQLKAVNDQSPMLSFVGIASVHAPPEEADTTKPVITLLGDANVEVEYGATYADAGATASDDVDGDISNYIVTTITLNGELVEELDTTVAGTYTYHYNVSDEAGNEAVEVTRTVIVRAKETPTTPDPKPTPTPIQPAIPQSTQQLSKDDFKQGVDGGLVVEIADGKEKVLLPSDVVEFIDNQAIRLNHPHVSLGLSEELMKQIMKEMNEQQATRVIIQLLAPEEARRQAVQQIADQVTAGTKLTLAGEVAELSFSLTTASGTSEPLVALAEPVLLSLKVDPEANANLLGVYAIAADGTLQYIGGDLVDGAIQVKVAQPGQYVVLEYNKQFTDVSDTFWASEVIKELAAKHIVNGVSDELFAPSDNVTRAEFTALITRVLGLRLESGSELGFTDVAAGAWYKEAIAAASQAGIIQGRGVEQFAPNAAITREEMAVIIMRAYQYASDEQAIAITGAATFSDYAQVSGWAQDAVQAARAKGIINGHGDGRFAPRNQMTRAESAQVIYNLLNKL